MISTCTARLHKHRLSGFLILLLSGSLFLASCGAASQSSGGSDSDEDYSGTASLSGTIVVSSGDLSQLGETNSQPSSSLSAKLSRVSSKLMSDEDNTVLSSGTAVLFEVKDDGSIVETGVTTPVVDGSYNFENIADGKKYIVRIVKVGEDAYGNKQLLKMDSFADIPDGVTTATADVTEKTGMVANYIVEKVIKTSGASFDKDMSTALYDKALEAVNDKLGSGDLIRISPVEAISSEDGILEFGEVSDTQKLNLEIIDNDDTLRDVVKQASFASRSSQINTLEDAKILIRAIFGQESQSSGQGKGGGDNNGPPDFFVTQFAQAWLDGVDVSILELATAYNASITNQQVQDYLTVEFITNALLAQGSNANDSKLRQLYNFYDNAGDDSGIPYYAKVIFPKNDRWTLPITDSQTMSVPQTLFFMASAGLIDGSVITDTDLREQIQDIPFDPFELLKSIDFVNLEDDEFYIVDKQVRPMKTYRNTGTEQNQNWQQVDALESNVQVYADPSILSRLVSVALHYPKADGSTGTAYYRLEMNTHGDNEGAQTSSMKKAKLATKGISKLMSEQSQNENPMDAQWVISPYSRNNAPPNYVTDYTSGEATITAYDADGEALVSGKVTIIKPNLTAAEWIYPVGQDMALLQTQGWDPDFQPTAVDVDESNQASPILKWTAPTGTIPDGHYLAYAINLGLSMSRINHNADLGTHTASNLDDDSDWDHVDTQHGYRWKQIWNSWDSNRLITTQSFRLPIALNRTERNQDRNYQTTYEVNITPVLVESKSGRVVWQGTDARTNFMVGTDDPWSSTISGTISFSNKLLDRLPRDMTGTVIPGTWKVGLFKTGGSNNQGQWTDHFHVTGSKSPVSTGNIVMIDTLGSSQEIVNAGYQMNYEFPEFSKTDKLLEKNHGYSVIVWYDIATLTGQKPNTPAWDSFGTVPQANKIDLSTRDYLEFFEHAQSNFWVDRDGIRIFNHVTKQSSSIVAPNTATDIDMSVGQYW